jgi:alkylation response protein AidB-like acyl-CoA dehydrogenase
LIDFALSDRQHEIRDRIEAFVRDSVIPAESELGAGAVDDALRRSLNARARAAGLLAPHVAEAHGGMGLCHVDCAVAFEAAGYSLLGPVALNCAAPDEGNMNLLARVGSEAQKERWLRPLAAAEVRSCFAMTEPEPGAGSDPAQLQTTVHREGEHYVVHGRKWLITGAEGAAFTIVMARNEPSTDAAAATMLLADMDSPGIRIERRIETTDSTFPGGHGEIVFEGLRVPADQVLGEEGRGLAYAQVRLAPARLTHCMRWLGAARRAHDIASGYARQRRAFASRLIEHEGVGFMLADNEIDLHHCRLGILHTAWRLDQGEPGRHESSMVKVFCSEALNRVVDRSQQILGGMGVTHDTVVARIATEIRAFRIYDGPSEVHRWAIARRLARA